MNHFMPIDFAFGILILIFTIRCAVRGFISELMSMAALVLGILASLYFFRKGGAYIREKFLPEYPAISEIIAFVLLFVVVFVVIKILERLLKDIIEGIKLGKADRFLGVIFGFIEGVIVVSLLIFIISVQPLFDPMAILNNSFFAEIILPFVKGRAGAAPAPDAALLLIVSGVSGCV